MLIPQCAMHRAYEWLKRCDPSRPVQYENARIEPSWDTDKVETIDSNTDIYCPMYPSPSKLVAYAGTKFTCFTRTNVQLLTPDRYLLPNVPRALKIGCVCR